VLFRRAEESEIEFPKDYRPKMTAGPSREGLRQALSWLREAKRPAILAGGGVWFSQAAELTRLAELAHLPVLSNAKARGTVSEDHPLNFGGFGAIHPAAHRKSGGGSADLVILLGTRIGMFTGGRNSVIPADARVIQIDIEPEEIGRNRDIQLGIVSDCREFVRQAIDALEGEKIDPHLEWIERLTAIREAGRHRFDDAIANHKGPIHPARLAHDIANVLDKDAIVVATAARRRHGWAMRGRRAIPGIFSPTATWDASE
jgi:acetolactate synthase-1/2/3 large subunit